MEPNGNPRGALFILLFFFAAATEDVTPTPITPTTSANKEVTEDSLCQKLLDKLKNIFSHSHEEMKHPPGGHALTTSKPMSDLDLLEKLFWSAEESQLYHHQPEKEKPEKNQTLHNNLRLPNAMLRKSDNNGVLQTTKSTKATKTKPTAEKNQKTTPAATITPTTKLAPITTETTNTTSMSNVTTSFNKTRPTTTKATPITQVRPTTTKTTPITNTRPTATKTTRMPKTRPTSTKTTRIIKTTPSPTKTTRMPKTRPTPTKTTRIIKTRPSPTKTTRIPKTRPSPTKTTRIIKTTPSPTKTTRVIKTRPSPTKTTRIPKTRPTPTKTTRIIKTTPSPTKTTRIIKTTPSPTKTTRIIKTRPSPTKTTRTTKTRPTITNTTRITKIGSTNTKSTPTTKTTLAANLKLKSRAPTKLPPTANALGSSTHVTNANADFENKITGIFDGNRSDKMINTTRRPNQNGTTPNKPHTPRPSTNEQCQPVNVQYNFNCLPVPNGTLHALQEKVLRIMNKTIQDIMEEIQMAIKK